MRILLPAFLLTLLGCSSPPKPAEKAAAPPEPVTGLHALAQMFGAARAWQPDVQVFRITSIQIDAVKPKPGRSGAWQAVFFSPTAQQLRSYTFSVADVSVSLHQGVFPDPPAPFSPSAQAGKPFPISAAKKDTDEIFDTALAHAKDYDAKHPGMPINYLLELNTRSPNAVWRVIWGTSASSSAFSVLVDASTGEFLRVLQ